MKASATQIRNAIDSPKPDIRLYLLHGPDESGAMELAARLARAIGPDVERIDLDSKALRESPGRLADEAASLSLFGGSRLIRVTGADENVTESVALLLAAERAGNPVVMIGPGLKSTGKLVKLALASPLAMAHACYVPEGMDAQRLVQTIAREHGLRLVGDLPQRMAAASGGDRAVLTREIEKLALYLDAAPDRPRDADARAFDAIGADLGDTALHALIELVIEGRVTDLGGELGTRPDGTAIPLLRGLSTKLIALAGMRGEVDAGASVDEVIEKQRIFFKEKGSTARALRRWNAAQLARAVDRVRETERAMMRSGSAGELLADAECVAVARAASRMR